MADVFDPTLIERPRVRLLGEEYEVRELTKRIATKVQQLQDQIAPGEDEDDEDEDLDQSVAVLSQMLDTMLSGREGLEDRLRAAWDEDAVSMETLARTAGWVQKVQAERVDLGNG